MPDGAGTAASESSESSTSEDDGDDALVVRGESWSGWIARGWLKFGPLTAIRPVDRGGGAIGRRGICGGNTPGGGLLLRPKTGDAVLGV